MKKLILVVLLMGLSFSAMSEQVGDWLIGTDTDAITGKTRHTAMSVATEGDGGIGVLCTTNNHKRIAIMPGGYIGGDYAQMAYRFDDGEPQVGSFEVAANGTALFFWDNTFYESMRAGKKLAVRVFDYRGVPVTTAVLSLLGASDATGLVVCE